MAKFVVRGLEEKLKIQLKRRAEGHGRTLEEEIIQILHETAKDSGPPKSYLGSRIAARLVADIPELRGQTPRPVAFKSCKSEE
jgi:plasmid stability protein